MDAVLYDLVSLIGEKVDLSNGMKERYWNGTDWEFVNNYTQLTVDNRVEISVPRVDGTTWGQTTISNPQSYLRYFNNTTWMAQTFTPTSSKYLRKLKVYLNPNQVTGATKVILEIYTDNGSNTAPTGLPLASTYLTGSEMGASQGYFTFDFRVDAPLLSTSQKYWLVFKTSSTSQAGIAYWGSSSDNFPNASPWNTTNSGSSWARVGATSDVNGYDFYFEISWGINNITTGIIKKYFSAKLISKISQIEYSTTIPANTSIKCTIKSIDGVIIKDNILSGEELTGIDLRPYSVVTIEFILTRLNTSTLSPILDSWKLCYLERYVDIFIESKINSFGGVTSDSNQGQFLVGTVYGTGFVETSSWISTYSSSAKVIVDGGRTFNLSQSGNELHIPFKTKFELYQTAGNNGTSVGTMSTTVGYKLLEG